MVCQGFSLSNMLLQVSGYGDLWISSERGGPGLCRADDAVRLASAPRGLSQADCLFIARRREGGAGSDEAGTPPPLPQRRDAGSARSYLSPTKTTVDTRRLFEKESEP